jgi:heat shock protein HslJ
MFRVLTGFLLLMVLPLFATHCYSESETKMGNISESVPDPAHNSQNSLDWAGTYRGITPCADCTGIATELVLSYDETFRLSRRYIGESDELFILTGSFMWSEAGDKIMLELDESSRPSGYRVQENRLIQLDMNGKQITGDLADRYVLAKTTDQLTNRFLELTTLNGEEILADQTGPKKPHIILWAGEQRLTGSGGCNTLNGNFQSGQQNSLSFSQIASTKMACADAAYENEFYRIIKQTRFYVVEGNNVHFQDSDKLTIATFKSAMLNQ